MRFALFMIAVLGVVTLAMGLPTRLAISVHEGDLFHTMEAALRMQGGALPHLDFMTPLGILAFAPMTLFLSLGYGGGQAALLSNLLVAVLISPAVWWVGQTRLRGGARLAFGAGMLILTAALVYGGGSTATSPSLFYNRWAWAVAIVVLVAVLFPAPRAERPLWLGLLVGAGLSALALTKMTYLVAFAPPLGIILIVQRRYAVAGIAVLVGAGVMIATALALGAGFWPAYAGDLIQVALHSQRAQPGPDLIAILGSPKFLAGTVALLGAIIWLRQTEHRQMGLYLLLLVPSFALVTWQNWGNDPIWLFLLGLVVWSCLPQQAGRAREQGLVLATIALVALAPTMAAMTMSLSRGVFVNWSAFARITDTGPLSDIWLRTERLDNTDIVITAPGLAGAAPPRLFNGAEVPDCRMNQAFIRPSQAYAQAVAQRPGAAGAGVFLADVVNIMPLLADQRWLAGGAPWYYGGDTGFADADYLVVPKCALSTDVRARALDAWDNSPYRLELVAETPLLLLFTVSGPQQAQGD